MKLNVSLISLTIVSLTFFCTTTTFAVGMSNTSSSDATKPTQGVNRSEKAKLRVCETRKKIITKRSESLAKLATVMQEKFDAIAQRVQNYYTTKLIPAGKTVPEYDSLVAEIQTKKNAVTTALANAGSETTVVNCDEGNPGEQLKKYNEQMKVVKQALQEYRTAIKNLIVAVRTASGQTTDSTVQEN